MSSDEDPMREKFVRAWNGHQYGPLSEAVYEVIREMIDNECDALLKDLVAVVSKQLTTNHTVSDSTVEALFKS